MNIESMINLAIFLVCVAVFHTSMCRLNKMNRRTKRLFRLKYSLLMMGAMAAGVAPFLFPQHPRIGGLVFALTVLFYLVSGLGAWRSRAPTYTECDTDAAPFDPLATGEFIAKRNKS